MEEKKLTVSHSYDSEMEAKPNAEYNFNKEFQAAYASWRTTHPSALEKFNDLAKFAGGRDVMVFLDYDGTLSELVSNPDEAFMTDEMRATLEAVASNFPTAILSGRSIRKVYEFVNLNNIYYSGNHGNTLMPPSEGNTVDMYEPSGDLASTTKRIYELLTEKMRMIGGAFVENNKCCVSVHIRNLINRDDAAVVDTIVRSEVRKYPDFCVMLGHEVLEVRPNNDLNKGTALEQLMMSMGYSSSEYAVPLFIGDDRTDEDAFRAVSRLRSRLSIVVSNVPKETNANYSLRNPKEVMQFLKRLVEWKSMM